MGGGGEFGCSPPGPLEGGGDPWVGGTPGGTRAFGCWQNPDYHGFSAEPDADVLNMRAVFFTGISLAIVLGSVFLHYVPDYG